MLCISFAKQCEMKIRLEAELEKSPHNGENVTHRSRLPPHKGVKIQLQQSSCLIEYKNTVS